MEINYYGLMIAIGVIIAFSYIIFVWYTNNIPMLWSLLFWTLFVIPIAIFGARLWTYFFHEPTRAIIDNGINFNDRFARFFGFFADQEWKMQGLSAHGAIVFGTLYLLIPFTLHSNRTQISLWNHFDLAVKGLLIVQIIGRWGNFFNEELLGANYFTDNYPQEYGWIPKWFATKIANPYNSHQLHHPLFLYESLGNFLILIVLLIIPQLHKTFYRPWSSDSKYAAIIQKSYTNFRKKKLFFFHRFWLMITEKHKTLNLYYNDLRFTNQKDVQSRTPFWSWFWFYKGKIKYRKWTSIYNQLRSTSLWYKKIGCFFQSLIRRDSTALSKHYGPWFAHIRSGNLIAWYLILANLLRFGLQSMRQSHDSMAITTPFLISVMVLGGVLWFWTQFFAPNHTRSRNWFYEILY